MKTIINVFLTATIAATVAGCGGVDNSAVKPDKAAPAPTSEPVVTGEAGGPPAPPPIKIPPQNK